MSHKDNRPTPFAQKQTSAAPAPEVKTDAPELVAPEENKHDAPETDAPEAKKPEMYFYEPTRGNLNDALRGLVFREGKRTPSERTGWVKCQVEAGLLKEFDTPE